MPTETAHLWSRLQPFTADRISSTVPKSPKGVYAIYRDGRPFYVGRSTSNIKGKLLSLARGTGNPKVRMAVESHCRLQFTWAEIMSYQQFEALLVKEFGARGRLGNLRSVTDLADRFPASGSRPARSLQLGKCPAKFRLPCGWHCRWRIYCTSTNWRPSD